MWIGRIKKKKEKKEGVCFYKSHRWIFKFQISLYISNFND